MTILIVKEIKLSHEQENYFFDIAIHICLL